MVVAVCPSSGWVHCGHRMLSGRRQFWGSCLPEMVPTAGYWLEAALLEGTQIPDRYLPLAVTAPRLLGGPGDRTVAGSKQGNPGHALTGLADSWWQQVSGTQGDVTLSPSSLYRLASSHRPPERATSSTAPNLPPQTIHCPSGR